MLYMKEFELAARLQHSASIDELMEGLNDRPEPEQNVTETSQSATASLATEIGARPDPTDHQSSRIQTQASRSHQRAA